MRILHHLPIVIPLLSERDLETEIQMKQNISLDVDWQSYSPKFHLDVVNFFETSDEQIDQDVCRAIKVDFTAIATLWSWRNPLLLNIQNTKISLFIYKVLKECSIHFKAKYYFPWFDCHIFLVIECCQVFSSRSADSWPLSESGRDHESQTCQAENVCTTVTSRTAQSAQLSMILGTFSLSFVIVILELWSIYMAVGLQWTRFHLPPATDWRMLVVTVCMEASAYYTLFPSNLLWMDWDECK